MRSDLGLSLSYLLNFAYRKYLSEIKYWAQTSSQTPIEKCRFHSFHQFNLLLSIASSKVKDGIAKLISKA